MSYGEGISVREAGKPIVIEACLRDLDGNRITSGTTKLYVSEVQDDGSAWGFDFDDNTFKSGALTTPYASMTHRQVDNSTRDTGMWTYVINTVTDFTSGRRYLVEIENGDARPKVEPQRFVYGGKARIGPHSKRAQTIDSGVMVIYDEDNTTPLVTLTPTESAGVATWTPS